ncbi:hypothetical protein ACO2Q3_22845 [Caulobacter sp. KR2-114]|uniref:hypothetical protein n=1 Tax=Caulobacter sp. KR2-114 TaxID=3400912 RepID=UPI003C0F35FA
MINADQCRKRANRLLRRATRIADPDARAAYQEQARSWMSLARLARWDQLFGGEDGGKLLH